jgi:undecaprenyl-diphosphatase
MTAELFLKAVILGLVEGATEFIPVSSTGHLIVVSDWLGQVDARSKTFDIFIQLGAILAIVWLYRARLVRVVAAARHDPSSRRFLLGLALAFLPAAAVGLLIHGWIKERLFNTPVVAAALIVGGIAILLIERWAPRSRYPEVADVPPMTALGIGVAQVLSLIPGTSRSGATIMGGYALGLSRKAATEFSFFLAIPTMLGASALDLYKHAGEIDGALALEIGVASLAAFITAIIVVRAFVSYLARHTFVPFGWYRIVAGIAMLALLSAR